ncbi:hypothetical protein BC938DRAFT_479312, partial [Jimgerdemannia flammicorona]
MSGWVPRRLGGGFGGRKESGQLRFGARDRPFKKPLNINEDKLMPEITSNQRHPDCWRSAARPDITTPTSRDETTTSRPDEVPPRRSSVFDHGNHDRRHFSLHDDRPRDRYQWRPSERNLLDPSGVKGDRDREGRYHDLDVEVDVTVQGDRNARGAMELEDRDDDRALRSPRTTAWDLEEGRHREHQGRREKDRRSRSPMREKQKRDEMGREREENREKQREGGRERERE